MKREIERVRELPAFSLSLGELETLWSRLLGLFNDSETLYTSIDIKLPLEKLEFSNIEELKEYKLLPPNVTNFSIVLSQKNRRVSLRVEDCVYSRKAQVRASSETEAWCAGAIDTFYTFIQSHKLWYNWFISAPIGWLIIASISIPELLLFFVFKGYQIDRTIVFSWITTLIVLISLYFFREKLLPAGILRISENNGFIRNHIGELSLILAIISVILTVVGWFITK